MRERIGPVNQMPGTKYYLARYVLAEAIASSYLAGRTSHVAKKPRI